MEFLEAKEIMKQKMGDWKIMHLPVARIIIRW